MKSDPEQFKVLVQERYAGSVDVVVWLYNYGFFLSFLFLLVCSLRRQVDAINKLADKGMNFFDYGNAFLLEASRAGQSLCAYIPVAIH